MNEQHLLKFALLASLIGLTILFLISKRIEINDTTIKKITSGEDIEDVKISGKITGIQNREKLTIIEISQQDKINVLLFDNNTDFSIGACIEVYGKVQEDNNQKSIVANKIKKC